MTEYFTIKSPKEGLFKDRGSKFLSFAFPVTTELEVKEIQDDLRKKFHDARHHCYAWVLGMDDQIWRANDDGEPSHSAGDPILGQIRSFGLTNTLVVVVRYFGGTKLGVGGLINAYKTAASLALAETEKQPIFECTEVRFSFGYDLVSIVERLIIDFEIEVISRDFRESCQIKGSIKNDLIASFKNRITDYFDLEVSFSDTIS